MVPDVNHKYNTNKIVAEHQSVTQGILQQGVSIYNFFVMLQ